MCPFKNNLKSMIFTASNVSRQQNSFNFIQLNIFFRIIAETRLTPPLIRPIIRPPLKRPYRLEA